MSRQITTEELTTLHQFCKRHYVHYYDVRIELVNQLASSIEALWEQEENIDFHEALDQVYKGFGATGFRNLIATKEALVEKEFNRGVLQSLKNINTKHKLFAIITFVLGSYLVYSYFSISYPELLIWYVTIIAILSFVHSIVGLVRINKWRKESKETLLATNFSTGIFIGYIAEFALINYGTNKLIYPDETIAISTEKYVVMCGLALIALLCNVALLQQARENINKAKERYPDQFAP